MSFITLEHSAIAWVEKELTKLEGAAPKIERIVDAGVTYVGPVLQIALGYVDPAALPVVNAVIAQAQSDLKVGSALVTDFGPTPTAASIFASVSTNLAGLLAGAHVTNPKSVAAVNKAITEVGAVAAAVTTAATAVSSAAAGK